MFYQLGSVAPDIKRLTGYPYLREICLPDAKRADMAPYVKDSATISSKMVTSG